MTPEDHRLFAAWVQQTFGPGWVVAPRLTERLKRRGYTVAIHQKKWKRLEAEWQAKVKTAV